VNDFIIISNNIKMNSIRNVFGSMTKGIKMMSPAGTKQKKIFSAYEAKDYGQVLELAQEMTA
jgi:hypothetical protein